MLDRLDVLSRLDFYFDALITRRKLSLHRPRQLPKGFLLSDRDAARDFFAHSSQKLPEWPIFLFRLGVPESRFDGALGHVVAANGSKQVPDFRSAIEFSILQDGP